jgi:hypothetical protein
VKSDATPITRFTKVTGSNSPYDPALRQTFLSRQPHAAFDVAGAGNVAMVEL